MSFEKNLNLSSIVPNQMKKIDRVKKSDDRSKIKNANRNNEIVIPSNNLEDFIEIFLQI